MTRPVGCGDRSRVNKIKLQYVALHVYREQSCKSINSNVDNKDIAARATLPGAAPAPERP